MKTRLIKQLALAVACCLSMECLAAQDGSWARFTEDGSAIVADVPGISAFRGVSSAVYESGGKRQRIGTQGFRLIGEIARSTGTTPFGEAEITTATYGSNDSPMRYSLTLKRLKSLRAFTLQGVLHNCSDEDLKLHEFDLLDLKAGVGGSLTVANAADWLVTPLMQDLEAQPLSEMETTLNEAAMVYHRDGRGFLVGPVGPAEAYTNVEVRQQAIKALARMDGVLVRPGESRRSEEMIFCFEPSRTSTDVWTRWVATTHGVRQHRGPVYGWCSWYDLTTKITAEHVLNVTKTIKDNPNTFGRGIIQIDDGYQKMDGDWSANEKFPMGMAAVAKEVRDAGCIPGVWFAPLMINPEHPWAEEHPDAIQTNAKGIASFMNSNPFHPAGANWVNPDHPATKVFLHKIISDARERGYGYIKIDFNGIGSRFVDPTKTRLQVFRDLYTLYRDAAGEDMYILSCLGQPTRGVIGFIDAARVGPDSHPAHFEKCLKSVLRFQIYDNVWWQNDPDVAYVNPKGTMGGTRSLGGTPQGEGMWRTWHNVVGLVGGTSMVSDPVDAPDVHEKWRNYEILRPAHSETTRLLTLGKSGENTTFGFAAQRPYGDFAVYNLYNPGEETRHINLVFEQAGLPSQGKCAVFDFWENKVIAWTEGSYNTRPLEYLSSALLRFTPLADDGRPTLVGSNLHLAMGATEIDGLRVSPGKVEIDLSDAGAQEGSLTFHSSRPLAAGEAENCTIASVEDLGDDLWRVNLVGREWGQTQALSLVVGAASSPAAE
jgi:hypothetical protein